MAGKSNRPKRTMSAAAFDSRMGGLAKRVATGQNPLEALAEVTYAEQIERQASRGSKSANGKTRNVGSSPTTATTPDESSSGTSKSVPRFIPDWTEFPVLEEMNLDEMLEERAELTVQKDTAELRLKELNSDIEAALTVAEVREVGWGNRVVVRCEGRSAAKFNPQRAVELGADPDILNQAWDPGKEYTYIQVRERKEGKV